MEGGCHTPSGSSTDCICVYSFHSDLSKYLLRTVPGSGETVVNKTDAAPALLRHASCRRQAVSTETRRYAAIGNHNVGWSEGVSVHGQRRPLGAGDGGAEIGQSRLCEDLGFTLTWRVRLPGGEQEKAGRARWTYWVRSEMNEAGSALGHHVEEGVQNLAPTRASQGRATSTGTWEQ